jgi:hypothetical protein
MVERYIKTVEEHLRKVVASNQKDRDAIVPLFLLAYRASTHDTTGFTPASLLFGRELRLPSELLFGTPPDKKRPTIEHAANLVDPFLWRGQREHQECTSLAVALGRNERQYSVRPFGTNSLKEGAV